MNARMISTLLALLVVAVPMTAHADAKAFADRTIALAAAYKVPEARQALTDNQEQYGTTAFYKGADGLAKLAAGDLDGAIDLLNQAANQNTADPAADYFRGEALYWKKSNDAAAAAWKRSRDRAKALVTAAPDDARANFYLGAASVRMKDFAAARAALTKAREKGFPAAMVSYQLGLCHAFEKKWQDAKTAFDQAIAANNGFAPAYFYRARVWKELRRTDEMMLDLDRFLKLAPSSLEAPIAKSMLAAGGG